MGQFSPKFENLVDVYEHATKRYANNPLFGSKRNGSWNWMTYAEFRTHTEEMRGGLAQLGINEGDRVAIVANNRYEWAVGAYATFGRKASYVPMYESQKVDEWTYILRDCNAKAVFAASDKIANEILKAKSELPDLQHIIVLEGTATDSIKTYTQLREMGRKNPVEISRPSGEDLGTFIYTSGTTGKPKGVKLSHLNLAANVSAMHTIFPMSPEDRSLSFLPWTHSFGLSVELNGLFSMGASMGIAESVDKIIDNIGEVKPTLLFSVPRVFNRIYDRMNKQMAEASPVRKLLFEAAIKNSATRKQLAAKRKSSGFVEFQHKIFDKLVFSKVRDRFGGRLRYAFSGGAALSKEVAEFIDNLGIIIYEGYGLTETSPIATANWPGARKIGSVGQAIPGVSIRIDLEASADPKHGEIVVHGHNVMKGYHGLPEENEKVFTSDGGFRTGDLGYLDDDGFLYITGRIKEQYKLENGKYVAPAPLEELLKLSPYVINAFVFGDNKPVNVALIVPDQKELEKWAESQNISARGEALLNHPDAIAFVQKEIDAHSKEFKQFERVKKLKLIGEDFTQENGLLTPKMSVKRRQVLAKYGAELEALYQ